MKKFSIVVPIYITAGTENILNEYVVPCLDSILKYTDLSNGEVILIVNGCTENTINVLSKYIGRGFQILFIQNGVGFPKAVNLGIAISNGKYIVLLNDDCVLLEQPINSWIDRLINPIIQNPNVGVTGPHKLICPYTDIQFVVGYCFCINRKCLNQIGLLDEVFTPGFGEDIDFCGRAIKNGWLCLEVGKNDGGNSQMIIGDFPIYHVGEVTFNKYHVSQQATHQINSNILFNRKANGYY